MDKRKVYLTIVPVLDLKALDQLKSFLKENNLPFNDVRLEGNQFYLYMDDGAIAGCGGLEFYGDYCLLRSVAVDKKIRGGGYGQQIVKDLISRAKDKHVWSVSLLTDTADKFFEKHFRFRKQSREDAPNEIKGSSEFSSVCPVSAAYMNLQVKEA